MTDKTGDRRRIDPSFARELVASPRWLAKVDVSSDGCWLWTGALTSNGYPKIAISGRGSHRYATRVALVALMGRDLLPGEVAGHACHDAAYIAGECDPGNCQHRRCVRPDHLVPQSTRENLKSGGTGKWTRLPASHCKRGHVLDEANTYVCKRGKRNCRKCNTERSRALMAARRASA